VCGPFVILPLSRMHEGGTGLVSLSEEGRPGTDAPGFRRRLSPGAYIKLKTDATGHCSLAGPHRNPISRHQVIWTSTMHEENETSVYRARRNDRDPLSPRRATISLSCCRVLIFSSYISKALNVRARKNVRGYSHKRCISR